MFFRTLVNIIKIDESLIHFEIPGWESNVEVIRPIEILPENLRNVTSINYFFANVNLKETNIDKLIIKDFELGEEVPENFTPYPF